jgi:hypothetical protein
MRQKHQDDTVFSRKGTGVEKRYRSYFLVLGKGTIQSPALYSRIRI